MDVVRKALQALVNVLGVKYGIALALVDRDTREVFYALTDDISPEIASEMFQMPGSVEHTYFDRQM